MPNNVSRTSSTMRSFKLIITALLIAFIAAPAARAALTIEIIGAGAKQVPVAIVQFRAEEGLPQQITPVITADLARSGLFRMVDAGGVAPPPADPAEVNYGTWSARGAEALVIGHVVAQPDGRYEVRFRLLDVLKQTQLAGVAYTASAAQLRLTAHKIADVIYEKLTGDVGVFSTRVTYVVKRGPRYELH